MASCLPNIHPDLLQVWCKTITDGDEFEIYPQDCYVLAAYLTPAVGKGDLACLLYTSEDAGNPGDRVGKINLYVSSDGHPDHFETWPTHPAVRFANGVYAKVTGAGSTQEGVLRVLFVDRRHFCPAFPRVQQSLTDCWDAARNEGIGVDDPRYEPYLTNFTVHLKDNPENPDGEPAGGDATVGDPI